ALDQAFDLQLRESFLDRTARVAPFGSELPRRGQPGAGRQPAAADRIGDRAIDADTPSHAPVSDDRRWRGHHPRGLLDPLALALIRAESSQAGAPVPPARRIPLPPVRNPPRRGSGNAT